MRKYRFTLVSVGAHFPGIIEEKLRKLVEVWPWVGFQAHGYRMMCLRLDAAIIPLADLPFNHYKSPIKWLEFSAMGVPAVVANARQWVTNNRGAKENAKLWVDAYLSLLT